MQAGVDCSQPLVYRFGLNAQVVGLDDQGCCTACGRDHHFKGQLDRTEVNTVPELPEGSFERVSHDWRGNVCSVHVTVKNPSDEQASVYYRKRLDNGGDPPWRILELPPVESYRFILAKESEDNIGPQVAIPPHLRLDMHAGIRCLHRHPPTVQHSGREGGDVSQLAVIGFDHGRCGQDP